LVELILRDNQLKELPPQIGITIFLSLCLRTITVFIIGRLPSLEVLDISRNQISVLPRQLIEAPKLKIVRLAGNLNSHFQIRLNII
jgi:Leucine-rich repeat (LRR) protein